MVDFEYPPSDSNSLQVHHSTTYDATGFFNTDGYCISQHFIPSSPGYSELGNALVENSSTEPQPVGHASIALPGLPLPSQPTPKHEPCGGTIGLNPITAEYGATDSGQSFSPMIPLSSPSLTGDHSPYIKEGDQEQHIGTSSMRRAPTRLHGHGSLRHRHTHDFRMVGDPIAYPGSPMVRSYLTISYTCSSTYRCARRHCAYLFPALTHISLADVLPRRNRCRSRFLIPEPPHRA